MKRRELLLSAVAALAPMRAFAQEVPAAAPVLALTLAGLAQDPVTGRLTLPASALPPPDTGAPVVDPEDPSPEAVRLRALYGRGRAAGLGGVLYDNRDRGHSAIPKARFPQMTRVRYGPQLRARNLDYGLAGAFRFPAITLGNSSTALVAGPEWRSQPRLAMTVPNGAARAAEDYAANALYVYPEHRDYDAVDYFPAAWPYTVTSQGSSGSDEPFLRTLGMILAAFPPDTRARMEALGLVVPTLQWAMRRTQAGLRAPAEYMSGRAHPGAFARAALNVPAAVALAASLKPGTIPPVPVLRVLAEDFRPRAGLAGLDERLFTTPGAVARLWRGAAGQREMRLSAAGTVDPAGRALRFHWVLLRGDPDRVTIVPEDAAGSQVRIRVGWQPPRRAPAGFGVTGEGPMSGRIDIGLFAEVEGAESDLSAPAFVSVMLPPEARSYEMGPDGKARPAVFDYDSVLRGAPYDPVLFWWAPWRDRFMYDSAGRFTGWLREATRPTKASVLAAGRYDAQGRRDNRKVSYQLDPVTEAEGRELLVSN